MRSIARAVVVLGLALPPALLATPAADAVPGAAAAPAAATTHPGLLQDAWFWKSAYQEVNPPVDPGAPPPKEPSGVPKGDLAVAHTSATESTSSKLSVLAFDLGTLEPGTEITNFVFSIKVDGSSDATNVGSGKQPIVACLPTRFWSAADGGDYSDAPPVDCADGVAPRFHNDVYTFTISGIASTWVAQNLGVALVNSPANDQTPYQVVFDPKSVKTTMDTLVPVTTPTGSGGHDGSGTPASDGGSSTPDSTTPDPSTPSGTVTASGPITPTNLPPAAHIHSGPPAAQSPQVAGNADQQPQAAPVASVNPAPSAPPLGFWLGAAAVAVLLLVASLVLGDSSVPVAGTTSSRLSRVLAARQRAAARADLSPSA